MEPCKYCGTLIDAEIHEAELGMCLECSNAYFEHDHDDCSWACMVAFKGKATA